MDITSLVIQQYHKTALLTYLAARFTYLSQEEWRQRIAEGLVLVNDKVGAEHDLLVTRDKVTYRMPDFIEPEADLNYTIIYEDASLLAINKPGNLLVHKHGRSIRNNLIYHLRENHESPYPTADIVNRLDRHTSGIVLVSKSKEILAELQALFTNRNVVKEYLAVVSGVVEEDEGHITLPLGPLGSLVTPQKQGSASLKCKEAYTDFRVVCRYASSTLLALTPHTGRTHQLRVHCAYLGHPILGDALYTLGEEAFEAWREGGGEAFHAAIGRQALHCTALHFVWRGKQYDFEAPLPVDMEKLLSYCEQEVRI